MMPVFSIKDVSLERVAEISFNLEIDIQSMVEKNMKTIFSLEFVSTEFTLNDLRIDSLGFDEESKFFVIIEYKRDRNFSVIDQGFAYLATLQKHKADFVLLYNEKATKSLKKEDIEWDQSKVIFISPSYTTYQRKAIEFKDLPVELWEIKRYSNNTVLFNQIQPAEKGDSITKIAQSSEIIRSVSKEIITYSEDYHLERCDDKTKAIYNDIKSRIMNLSPTITIKARKMYIAFASNDINFVYLSTKRSALELHLRLKKGELADPKKAAIDISDKAHFQGVTQYLLKVDNNSDLGYVISLIGQAFDKTRASSE